VLAVVGGAAAAAVLLLRFRFSVYSPGARTSVETYIMTCGVVSGWWLGLRFKRRRRLSNLLTVAGLMALAAQELAFFALPSLFNRAGGRLGTPAPHAAWLVVGFLFAAAAFVPRRLIVRPGREWRLAAAVVGTGLVLTISLDLGSVSIWRVAALRTELTAVAVALVLIAGAGFARSALQGGRDTLAACLAGAAILLAAAWSYDLLAPETTAGSLSGRECLRIMAYGLIVTVALSTRRRVRRAESADLAAQERRRLARDLHDGMAQDLACIAAYGEQLVRGLGPEHPLVIAARRALEATRGAVTDLSAAANTTAGEALRAVADELSLRHGVRIQVRAEGDDLPRGAREEIVRIAREAMVNAIEHGRARTVAASLKTGDGHIALTVEDDGCGIGRAPSHGAHRGQRGYGIQAMRERAAALDGQLRIHERAGGGTTVQVRV
jgi:signal transduction histidine kinase